MSLLLVALISFLGIILGKLLFKKWFNHLSLYCMIWGVMILLYELKLLPYPDILPLAWFFMFSAFLSFLLGILTIISARNLFSKEQVLYKRFNVSLKIFVDQGKTLKYSIIFFSIVSLLAAVQNWMVLIDMFGSIPGVFLNANTIYRLNIHGGVKGVIPFVSAIGYVAIFFSGIYTAYKAKFSFLSFLPFVGIIIKELATVGRAGMLLALMEFLFTFFLFRNLLKNDLSQRFKFSKRNAIVAVVIIVAFFITSASLVRITRGSTENFLGASKELRQLKDNMIFSPSIYLYLSSCVGVLNQYLYSDSEETGFGQNTFLPGYFILAKLGVLKRPSEFQKGYFIPMWTNTGTYIRELHADFGITGVYLVPYLIGLLVSWLWFKFYEKKNLFILVFLVYLYLIIGFSFLVMVTRVIYWFISIVVILLYLPVLKKLAIILGNRYNKNLESLS